MRGVPKEVQFAVAEMFWAYMNRNELMPDTRTMLGKLYNEEFKPKLANSTERRVNFGLVLFSLRKIGVVKWPRRNSKDNKKIVYNAKGRKVPVEQNLAHKLNEVNMARLDLAQLAEKLKKTLVEHKVDLARDKGNISISPPSDINGVIDLGIAKILESKRVNLTVTNESNRRHMFGCVTLGSVTDYIVENGEFEFMGKDLASLVELGGKQSTDVTIPVTIDESCPGIFHVVVAFWFKCGKGQSFLIVKFIKVDYRDDVVDELQPTEPYEAPVPRKLDPNLELIKGEPLATQDIDYKVELKRHPVPKRLRHDWEMERLETNLPTYGHGETPEEKHCVGLSVFLHVEELQMEVDIQRYNMEAAKLKEVSSKKYLALAVPGLAENRPSLIRGDRLFVRKLKSDGTQEKKEYEGVVHDVERDEVHLKFHKTFHDGFVANMSFSVRFTFRRTSLQLMHRALKQAPSYLKIRIPFENVTPSRNVESIQPLRYYNRDITENEEQKQAVENIVMRTSRHYPYLVFGPPGTGKTVTLVEAIKQVLFKFPQSKVLACAPSNAAADLILERVAQHNVVPKTQMVRLNAFGRSKKAVNPDVLEFCKIDGDMFYLPTLDKIKEYRLVVTTLITAGRLVSLGIGDSHFTHIFIDEAGQGMEPECFVAVAGLLGSDATKGGQLVLAGDPKQLGPVLRSPIAIRGGLGVSFLERLMAGDFSCYNRQPGSDLNIAGPYDAKMITKLLRNYRSHPHIIEVPNDLFYEGELQPCANVIVRESLCQWDGLPVKNFPVIFEGVKGKDEREKRNPSFFNPQEVSAVLRYVKNLKDARGNSAVKTDEIGIISPYNQQVRKIREKLRNKPYDIRDIKVGSIEEFQGQERKVIIISTVRSSEEFLYFDASHKLGFLKNPKRFNVAITRAKALLIVIGNPHVLCRDQNWRRFIGFCQENGSYKGCAFEMPDIDDEYLRTQLEKLELDSDVLPRSSCVDEEDSEWKPPEA